MNAHNDDTMDLLSGLVLFLVGIAVGIGFIIYSFYNTSVYFLLFGVLVIICCILMVRGAGKVDCYKCKERVSRSALICKHCKFNFPKSYIDSYVPTMSEHINFSLKGYLQRCIWIAVIFTLFILVGQFTDLLDHWTKIPASGPPEGWLELLIGLTKTCAVLAAISYIWKFFKFRYNTWGDPQFNDDPEPLATHEPSKTVIHCPSCNQGLRVAVPLGKLVEITCPNSNCKKTFRHHG